MIQLDSNIFTHSIKTQLFDTSSENHRFSLRKSNFLRRVPDEEWDAALKIIQELGHVNSAEELNAFHVGQWDHPIFQDPNWIYFAFHEYLQNNLSEDKICKLFLYNECQKTIPSQLKIFQLIKYGQIDQEALDILRKSTRNYLNDEAFEKLINYFLSLPSEDTQFFAVKRLFEDPAWTKMSRVLDFFMIKELAAGPSQGPRKIRPMPLFWQTVAAPSFVYAIHKAQY